MPPYRQAGFSTSRSYIERQKVCSLVGMTRRVPSKINTYVGLDREELAIVRSVQQKNCCSASAAVRALIRAGWESQIASPRLSVEKEKEAS